MSTTPRVLVVRRPLGEVEIEVHPAAAVDAAAREASLREIRQLVLDARQRHPEALRAVLTLRARLSGDPVVLGATRAGVDAPHIEAAGQELVIAARGGLLVARRRERAIVAIPADAPSSEALGPESTQEEAPPSKSWVGVVLVDQDGNPVPGRPYRIVKPDGTTLDGTLDAHGAAMIKGLDPGNCQIWCPYVQPHPKTTVTVKPGDHVSGIAQAFGFDDFNTVWNDPDNSDLQSKRDDPHVLQPGDELTVPEVKDQPGANKPTGAKHQFQIAVSPLKLRLTLLDLAAKPVSGAQVTLDGASLTSDGSGLVEATLDKSKKDADLVLPSGEVDLVLGGLNPSDDTSEAGYKARLFNLGFLWDPTAGDSDDEMVIALQDFQAQYSLTLSGQLDDATKGKLVQVHGC